MTPEDRSRSRRLATLRWVLFRVRAADLGGCRGRGRVRGVSPGDRVLLRQQPGKHQRDRYPDRVRDVVAGAPLTLVCAR
jgi:hypothetical protein